VVVERIIPDALAPNDRTLTEHVERYELAAALLRPEDIVIDAACGVGYGSAMLARQCRQVYSYDNAPEAIAYAVAHYTCDNIEFAVLDLDQAALAACDILVSFETIEHLLHPTIFLDKAKSAAGRLIILSTPIVPTQAVNPFHLHDFDQGLVEELMRPWRPAYFCIQPGAGNALNGIWVFEKGEDIASAAAHRLVALNLHHQQTQVMHQYDFLERQQARVKELEQGKAWLEEQRTNWQRLAEARQAWNSELEQGKAWLEEQWTNWQRLAEERERSKAQIERIAQAQQRYLDDLQSRFWFRLLTWLRLLPSFLAGVNQHDRSL